MPCSDGRTYSCVSQEDINRCKNRLDEVTRHLCYVCGQATENGTINELTPNSPRLQQWWEEHQRLDETRVLSEMLNSYFRVDTPENMAQEFIERAEKVHAVSTFHKKWFHKLAEKVFREA